MMNAPTYVPAFSVDADMINRLVRIEDILSKIVSVSAYHSKIKLRRESNIRSIHSSLAIEGNKLSIGMVTDIIDGKRVVGDFADILEVKNAYTAYGMIGSVDIYSIDGLLEVYDAMMFGLVSPDDSGLRDCKVAVYDGDVPIHTAPEPDLVEPMVLDLLEWSKTVDVHPLVKGSAFHYQLEYIHPFVDGNGRMGRLWHSAILSEWKSVFLNIPLEPRIQKNQSEYYHVLEKCDKTGDCSEFIKLCLRITEDVLLEIMKIGNNGNLSALMSAVDNDPISASDIMKVLGLAHRTHFMKNYLHPAIEAGLIEMTDPDLPKSRKQKYRKKR
jgi:Fic family protein